MARQVVMKRNLATAQIVGKLTQDTSPFQPNPKFGNHQRLPALI